jgi:3-keto-disaccharide hydrolase
MTIRRWLLLLPVAAALFAQRIAPMEETGFRQIFDGQSLKGWDCDADFWRVDNGVIVGETRADHQPKQNIFCIWRDGKPADFELKLQYRLSGADTGNSGIQYRSIERPDVAKWVMQGYQADIDARQQYTGQIYEERGRGFLALRGQINYVADGKKPANVGSVGDTAQLKDFIKINDWNDLDIIARGSTLIQLINGHVMSELIDEDKAGRKMDGLIGIQLHRTSGPMKIEARNIRIKDL